MTQHIFHDFAQVRINPNRVITVDSSDQVRALANVGLILITPFNPFVILIRCFRSPAFRNGGTDFIHVVTHAGFDGAPGDRQPRSRGEFRFGEFPLRKKNPAAAGAGRGFLGF
jgi:hypothetical protein